MKNEKGVDVVLMVPSVFLRMTDFLKNLSIFVDMGLDMWFNDDIMQINGENLLNCWWRPVDICDR